MRLWFIWGHQILTMADQHYCFLHGDSCVCVGPKLIDFEGTITSVWTTSCDIIILHGCCGKVTTVDGFQCNLLNFDLASLAASCRLLDFSKTWLKFGYNV